MRADLSIETGGAQFAIPLPGRTKVDDVVAWRNDAARLAKGFVHVRRPFNAERAGYRPRRSTS